MRAYGDEYLWDASNTLGEAFDCAVNRVDFDLQEFFELFITTGVAEHFGQGNPRYIAGMSGPELVLHVTSEAGLDAGIAIVDYAQPYETPEYWCGWILAYYQWATGRTFRSIASVCSVNEVLELYHPLHEASEEKFVELMENRARKRPTQLASIRRARGFSQEALAQKSGVSLRAIQQYEQRVKDINRMQLQSAHQLARALGCSIDDLLEFPLK